MYKAAVIGLGFIGAGDPVSGEAIGQRIENLDGTHAQSLAQNDQIELVAGSSRDEGRRRRFAERMGVKATYADWREMLRSLTLDIVAVATYTPWHAEVTIACAQAGVRAVMCEKPLAVTLKDTDRMIEACKQHGTLLSVNHPRRWHPLWRALASQIRQGLIGDIRYLAIHWPAGRLGNYGTHMFDAAAMLLGCTPEAVAGNVDTFVPPDCRGDEFHDPGGWGIIRYQNGVRVHVEASPRAELPHGFRIFGTKGWIDVGREIATIYPWDGEPSKIEAPAGRPPSLDLGVDELVACLDGRGTISATGEAARAAMEAIVGFHVSHKRNGQWVPLPIMGADRDFEVRSG